MAERKRIGVPISGLDTSTPDHSVVDGKCETLHNLRYTGEAWRNVKGFEQMVPDVINRIEGYANPKIVYKHPADDDNAYIVQALKDSKTYIFRTAYNKDNESWDTTLISEIGDAYVDYSYNHFGNILSVGNPIDKTFSFFLRQKNNAYTPIKTIEHQISLDYNLGESVVSTEWTRSGTNDSAQEIISAYGANDGLVTFNSIQGSKWRGEVAVFATISLDSGDEIYRSSPLIINTAQTDIESYNAWVIATQNENEGWGYPALQLYNSGFNNIGETKYSVTYAVEGLNKWYNNSGDEGKNHVKDLRDNGSPCSRLYSPIISVKIGQNGIRDLAEMNDLKLNVYITRIHPLFNIELLVTEAKNVAMNYDKDIYPYDFHKYYQDNDLFNQPFYLLDSFSLRALNANDGSWGKDIVLSAANLERVIHNPTYQDTMSYMDIYSDNITEINNRWHLISPYNSTTDPNDINVIAGSDYDYLILRSKNSTYAKVSKRSSEEQGFLLTAPSSISTLIFVKDSNALSFPMKENTSLVLSTYLQRSYSTTGDWLAGLKPYCNIKVSDFAYSEGKDFNPNEIVFEKGEIDYNRVQVSSLNTNLNYEYGNSYRFGSADNRVFAINSAAIEMSDSKFGEFPVYVFTKEGIFAMQSGKETVYSNIIPSPYGTYDVIINPNTLAVNGAVLYFTDKGLHALTNQGAKLLSAPVHTAENRIPDWMRTTQMIYLPEWNEVLCTDLPNKKAYVYSLDNNVWSTRDIPEGYILNNDELVATSNEKIYNLRNEKEQLDDEDTDVSLPNMPISLVTRPIKLGSMELKRAETIIVRFECPTEQTLNVEVEGSVDTKNWMTLRKLSEVKTNKDILIRRTPCSVKYLRFKIDGNVTDDIRILAFEVEYYERWMRKMR